MIKFPYLEFRAYAHATEDLSKVKEALLFIGKNKKEASGLKEQKLSGYFGNPIVLLVLRLKDKKDISAFWERVLSISSIKELLLQELEQRVDKENNFYIRFDKQAAFNKEIKFTRGDDAIRVRAKIIVYPSSHAKAVEELRNFLGKF
jgi:hypothetical protein